MKCLVSGCKRARAPRLGVCATHYAVLMARAFGLPTSPRDSLLTGTREQKFWDRVDRSAGPTACWPWTGGQTHNGYGKTTLGHRPTRAHRLAYVLSRGPIPAGLHVLHTCDNPPCCNPDHLYVGTPKDNSDDKYARGRQPEAYKSALCARGHVLTPRRTEPGRRRCLSCNAAAHRARRAFLSDSLRVIRGRMVSPSVPASEHPQDAALAT